MGIDYKSLHKGEADPYRKAKKEIETFAEALRDGYPLKSCYYAPYFLPVGVDDFKFKAKFSIGRNKEMKAILTPGFQQAEALGEFMYKNFKNIMIGTPYAVKRKRPKKSKIQKLYLPFSKGEFVTMIL